MRERVDDLRCWMRKDRVLGTFLKLPSNAVVEIAAESFDFAVVDREHSQLSEGDALAMAGHARAIGFPAVVRLPELDAAAVNRALEAGAVGIQLSQVETGAQLEGLRSVCEYSPLGRRSVSLGHSLADFGAVPLDEYVRNAAHPLIVAQIESLAGAANADEILGSRPDVAFLGLSDLNVDAGFDQEKVKAAIELVREAAARHGVFLGAINMDDPDVRYSMISSDVDLLRRAMLDAPGRSGQPTRKEAGDEG